MSPEVAADSGPRGELARFLSRPGLRRLWPAVRERLETLGGVRGTVRLPAADEEERRAVADLLGLATLPRGEVRVRLDRLDRALRESRFGVGVDGAVAALSGPLRDLAGERERDAERRRRLWDAAASHSAVALWPDLVGWLSGLRASGLLQRLAAGGDERALLEQALAVLAALAALPAGNGVRLPVLASGVLGGSHALDPGNPTATLVLRALAWRAGRPPPRNAGERRELWEHAGAVTDDLSCNVLTLGLAPLDGGPAGAGLRHLAAAGEPVWITLRQLSAPGLDFPPHPRVRVCENPVVVAAAAERWGSACLPLVCLNGFPNHAARTLLRRLAGCGAEICYHGDFDWAGLRIANSLAESVPLRPWRFQAADYRAALRPAGASPRLSGTPVEASWDPELGQAMAEDGRAVEEESVLADLLADLEE